MSLAEFYLFPAARIILILQVLLHAEAALKANALEETLPRKW